MNRDVENCHWCEQIINDSYVYIEGFLFCDESCECRYYTDRLERKKMNKLPLLIERIRKGKIAT